MIDCNNNSRHYISCTYIRRRSVGNCALQFHRISAWDQWNVRYRKVQKTADIRADTSWCVHTSLVHIICIERVSGPKKLHSTVEVEAKQRLTISRVYNGELAVSNLNTIDIWLMKASRPEFPILNCGFRNAHSGAVVLHKVWEHAFAMDSSGSLPGLGWAWVTDES